MEYQTESEFTELLAEYRALPQRRRVLEIGSMLGDTLREWMKHGEPGMTLISVDKMVPAGDARHAAQVAAHRDWERLALAAGAKLVVIDDFSQTPQTIAKVKAALAGGALDFLFIDGGHDYATVRADYENYAPLVRPGGLIAFHDIQGIAEVKRLWEEVKAGLHLTPALSPLLADSQRGEGESFEICQPHGWGIGGLKKADDRAALHLITPCSRPENLPQLAASLANAADYFRVTWWLVADEKTDPKVIQLLTPARSPCGRGESTSPRPAPQSGEGEDRVRILQCHEKNSVAGKAQINRALAEIHDGWVWVLDDDNAAHPEFFRALRAIITSPRPSPQCGEGVAAVAFAQLNRQGGVRAVGPDTVRECGIDQAQFVVRRDLIGDERYSQKYTADGEFAERLHKKNPAVWEFCHDPLTYYNWLR